MAIEVEVQRATSFEPLPGDEQFRLWITVALGDLDEAEVVVRLVDQEEIRRLNARYRGKDSVTNVLSFPAELPEGLDLPLLGDIVICASTAAAEAATQGKQPEAHWAHLTVHGLLHLLGYDHLRSEEAEAMESLEAELLGSLGFPDPYN